MHQDKTEDLLTNLHDEADVIPRVLPHQDPSEISHNLHDATQQHATHEAPDSVSDPQPQLDDGADGVEGDEEDGKGQACTEAVDAELDGAGGNGAVGVVAARGVDEAVGVVVEEDVVRAFGDVHVHYAVISWRSMLGGRRISTGFQKCLFCTTSMHKTKTDYPFHPEHPSNIYIYMYTLAAQRSHRTRSTPCSVRTRYCCLQLEHQETKRSRIYGKPRMICAWR